MRLEDWLGEDNQIGQDIWHKKYQYQDETLDEWFDRVSGGDDELKQLIKEKKFLYGGRTLTNRNVPNTGNLFNCFSAGFVPDDYAGIMDTLKEVGITFKAQGGQGISMSKLRPKGSPIGDNFQSDGIIPFIEMFNVVTQGTSQGGARKGALMISLDVRHKEAENFIKIKTDIDAVTKANLSLEIDDEFMAAVQKYYADGETVVLHEKREYSGHVIEYDVVPIELYKLMMRTVWDYGEPGCIFTNRFRNYNFLEYDDNYQIETCNPCLHPDTLIQTTNGLVKIKDMTEPMMVYCMDEDEKLTARMASPSFISKHNVPTLKLTLNNGASIQLTPNHLLYLKHKGWTKAEDIVVGDIPIVLLRSRRGACYSGVRLSHNPKSESVMEHRFIYEAHNGKLKEDEDVHHINGNTYDNRIDNIVALSHSEHATLTRYGCDNDHQVRDSKTGRFISSEDSKHGEKEIKQMPDELATNFEATPRIVSIEDGEATDVYDITVEELHNFVADGIIVHNCGEQPLKRQLDCCLGSINLYEFVKNKFTDEAEFDFTAFDHAIEVGSRALDAVIDENAERLSGGMQVYADNALQWRNIGLGVFGYADMLMAMKLRYGSRQAIRFTDVLFKKMMQSAVIYNIKRAKEFGTYPMFDKEAVKKSEFYSRFIRGFAVEKAFEKYGFRNCTLLSIAPTGTIATMTDGGRSGGTEPEFSLSYTRRTDNLAEEYKIEASVVKDYRKITGDTSDKLPNYFVESADIPWRNRIDTQAVIQKYVDTAISSTVNLPKKTTVEEIEQLYLYAWQQGLKGVTIFRDGCKRLGILIKNDDPSDSEESQVLRRGDIINVSDDLVGYKRKVVNGCGDFSEQIFFDDFTGEPLENFIAMGDGGGCSRNLEAISRLISLGLRGGIDISEIIKQLKKVRPCPAYRARRIQHGDTSEGTSCPSAIGFAIESLCSKINDRIFDSDDLIEVVSKDVTREDECKEDANLTFEEDGKCPECGSTLQMEGGCVICRGDDTHPGCGWSKCE